MCVLIFTSTVPAQLLHSDGRMVSRVLRGSVSFNCTADGIPRPQISWRKNRQLLNIGHLQARYRVNTTYSVGFRSSVLPGVQQVESVLTINTIREQDEGTFTCIAQSEGSSSAMLNTDYKLFVEKRKSKFLQSVISHHTIHYFMYSSNSRLLCGEPVCK